MSNVEIVVNSTDDDPYYEFKWDLGQVKSIAYKNIAWVAQYLLVELDGETTLNLYKWDP